MVHTTSSPKLMSAQTCTDAVAALARLAAADPYTAVEACGLLPAGLSHHSAPTAISATKPPTTIKQASSPMQLSPQQSTASALHLLQQLLASPASSNDSTSDGEVNSRAISASQASGVRSNTRTQVQRPVLTTAAETVRGPDRPSRLQARGSPVATADTLAPTAGSFEVDEASDWTIIDDFCNRTVSRSQLRLLLHAWHVMARSHTKWRCIQQVCFSYLLCDGLTMVSATCFVSSAIAE